MKEIWIVNVETGEEDTIFAYDILDAQNKRYPQLDWNKWKIISIYNID